MGCTTTPDLARARLLVAWDGPGGLERRAAVAVAFGVSARTVGKWVARW